MTLAVIFLMGPTATGKTDIAAELFKRLPVELISVDSALVYRGMDIGTAKPSREFLNNVPHRLIDICEPDETYSAARFRDDALLAIDEIHSKNKVPLLVGGTGLYFRALESGISDLPDADAEVRQRLEAEARDIGWQAMHDRLAEIDPVAAERIHPNDPQRIQRALEVYEISGRSMTDHYADAEASPFPFELIKIILNPGDRAKLHERIEYRFMNMLDEGLVDEVRAFHANGRFSSSLPAMRMVGYRQVWNYLDGETDYEEMVEKGIVATRQLAKRQMTWLRKEDNGIWLDSDESGLVDKIQGILAEKAHLLA
ncbi:MAG: tRNA (adenosine(37)-N6)-dimethylallyltransferase MiaA [Gammaproteobacteria bacterium]|nr:MAG: tRNA (adenosine(37)-N6)-dimethylallyltransferase MiaA [Gammaproteobacteria bacterium]RKZ65747.1 MAG: tRNA (adenosine(37)-N6)-dimethylallyltransferase MiaA [Gammaproteobacteria bacterium]